MDVVKETAVDVRTLNSYMEKTKARCVVRIFDACRAPIGGARVFFQGMSRGLEAAMLKAGQGWATFNSCSSGEAAWEHSNLENGVFTNYLCEGLEGRAADEKGIVRWDRLVDFIKTSVSVFCKEQGLTQTPHAISDLS